MPLRHCDDDLDQGTVTRPRRRGYRERRGSGGGGGCGGSGDGGDCGCCCCCCGLAATPAVDWRKCDSQADAGQPAVGDGVVSVCVCASVSSTQQPTSFASSFRHATVLLSAHENIMFTAK
ncbi:unnamed protein product [Haemonchus placei]|uniref:Uncharacterized protein n=1 Tax=Haemonchus placei TaxID=6290 RepID=A0A0N4WXG2_HAEPC|nr:unnamed protein product [Haemonchus placei]